MAIFNFWLCPFVLFVLWFTGFCWETKTFIKCLVEFGVYYSEYFGIYGSGFRSLSQGFVFCTIFSYSCCVCEGALVWLYLFLLFVGMAVMILGVLMF